MHILGANFTHVEAAGHAAHVTFLTDVLALFVILLLQTLAGCNGQVAVLQVNLHLVLVEAGQVNSHFVVVAVVLHVGLHQVLGILAVQGAVNVHQVTTKVVKQIIKHGFMKNARKHTTQLLLKSLYLSPGGSSFVPLSVRLYDITFC